MDFDTHKDHVDIAKSFNSKIIVIGESIAYGLQGWKFVESMETICCYCSLKLAETMEQFFV